MICGNIIMEDTSISFQHNQETGEVTFTVIDALISKSETKTVPQDKFFKALAIAVHNDGMPDYNKDYDDAESIMGEIRWIP